MIFRTRNNCRPIPAPEFSRGICVLLIAVSATFSGCETKSTRPASAEVSGKVTFGGQPVTEGTVNFISSQAGGAAAGELDGQGQYKISAGVPPGKYTVFVTPPANLTPPKAEDPAPPTTKEYHNIPEKYRDEQTSDLSVEIKAGDNPNVDFKLE